MNFCFRVGAVGFVSVLFPFLLPLSIIRINKDTGEPMRDQSGLAQLCDDDEAGELVGRIDRGHPVRDYHGYADNSSSDRKIIRDVWRKGDMFFRSGDVFMMDEFGWLYFKDRAGDTFRWKGENVSTMEVEAMISQVMMNKNISFIFYLLIFVISSHKKSMSKCQLLLLFFFNFPNAWTTLTE